METRLALPRDHRRVVDRVDGEERDLVVPVEPLVELRHAQREGGHRHAVEHPLGVVGDLPGLVQLHETRGEHLRMDAEPAERPTRQFGRHDVGNGADARLQRGPVLHIRQCVARNGRVRAGVLRRRIGEREGCAVGLDEHVNGVERNGVVVGRGQALGAGQVRVDLHDEQPLGIPPGAQELVPGPADVQREVDGAAVVGRRALRHHHAGSEPGHDRPHLPEAPWDQFHAVAHGEVEPLRRTEEAAAVADPGFGEDVVQVQAEGTADLQVLPVVPGPQCGQQAIGDARAEPEADLIDRPDKRNGLLQGADIRHGPTLALQWP